MREFELPSNRAADSRSTPRTGAAAKLRTHATRGVRDWPKIFQFANGLSPPDLLAFWQDLPDILDEALTALDSAGGVDTSRLRAAIHAARLPRNVT